MERTALDAVRALFQRISNMQVTAVRREHHVAPDCRFDAGVDFDHDGTRYVLLIEIKSNGVPCLARSAIYHLESCIARSSISAT